MRERVNGLTSIIIVAEHNHAIIEQCQTYYSMEYEVQPVRISSEQKNLIKQFAK